jgi:ATP-dependent RNA helicase DDX10/DBP4
MKHLKQRQINSHIKRKKFQEEVDHINERLNEISSKNFIDSSITEEFDSLPLLTSTKELLRKNKFVRMSDIQKQTLLYSLCGKDVIGVSETGSGKTLAFLIPIIECLQKEIFSSHSGIGAIIISPTRVLASQTFEVLKKLNGGELSIGLITGGLNFKLEQEGLKKFNILVSTVGRLKEHGEKSYFFNAEIENFWF